MTEVLGVGFGPSNLALAIALRESAQRTGVGADCAFVERQQRFGWHRGMLIEDATMQVSFIKDLVTMRDPTSRYSFVAYLHAHGRLPDFVNHKTLVPTRLEFHDYLEWAAREFEDVVAYGQEASSVEPVVEGGRVVALDVTLRAAGSAAPTVPAVRRTRNLVIACGLRSRLPDGFETGEDVWHSAELMHRTADLDPERAWIFVVIGAGQSAAETVEYLHRRFRNAVVHSVFARHGYSPADDSPFVNGIFDPAAVDTFYNAPDRVRQMLLDYHGNTNYSAVDVDLVEELYRRVYAERVSGEHRLRIRNISRVAEIRRGPSGPRVAVEFLPSGELTEIAADQVVCATGYQPIEPEPLLGSFLEYCKRDDRGGVVVDRGHRVVTEGDVDCAVYVQGTTERTHGISSSLLSTTAIRAGEIADAVLETEAAVARAEHGGRAAGAGVCP
jgi:L-ornithine N5-oxygenase